MYTHFIDLDELIERCQDEKTKKFIQEAVNCYRVGAFRYCIVATWNAIVFDYLNKLRQLELVGNGDATQELEKFESKSLISDFKGLWDFESNIPEVARKKFELISPVEQKDIIRIFEDRSRCAHPSMTSLDEPFEATAEQARSHLRNAVIHFLQYPPVQGRAAIKKIWEIIKSNYFPTDVESAIISLKKSHLARARFSVIQDIVIGLTVSLLTEENPEDERERQFSAINAISQIHPNETNKILNSKLSSIIVDKVVDTNWDKVIIYLFNVKSWDKLDESCYVKAKVFIDKLEIKESSNSSSSLSKNTIQKNIKLLIKGSYLNFLEDTIRNKVKISFIKVENLLSLKTNYKDKNFSTKIINPLIQEKFPNLELKDLLSIRGNNVYNTSLKNKIELYLPDKIKTINDLKELTYFIHQYEDEFIVNLIEPYIKDKIVELSLENIESFIEAKENYEALNEPNQEIIQLFNNHISIFLNANAFDDLYNLYKLNNVLRELPKELIKSFIINNTENIVDKFIKSSSWLIASRNAALMLTASEYFSDEQWECILKAIYTNSQIYSSYHISNEFVLLFKKAIELNSHIKPYWFSFRKEINNFEMENFKELKKMIDSYHPPF
jgi:hypothetical protein